MNAQARARHAKNPELHRARVRDSRIKHRDKRLIYQRKWSADNRDNERARSLEYRRKNLVELNEKSRLYGVKHKERRSAYQRKWQKENLPRMAAHSAKRRAIKLGATIGNPQVILEWETRWRNAPSVRCYWCENYFPGKDCHSDHIVPLIKGGSHEIGNLCVACEFCNTTKHDKIMPVWNQQLAQPVLI